MGMYGCIFTLTPSRGSAFVQTLISVFYVRVFAMQPAPAYLMNISGGFTFAFLC